MPNYPWIAYILSLTPSGNKYSTPEAGGKLFLYKSACGTDRQFTPEQMANYFKEIEK